MSTLRSRPPFFRAFAADCRGLAAVEFAMIVPLMLVMFFGTFEVSQAVAVDRKVTLVARTLSDLISQSASTITDANLQNAFTAAISVATPFDPSKVKTTISEVSIDANGIATVVWSRAATVASPTAKQATLATSTRNSGDKITSTIPQALRVPSTYLIMSEVSYSFSPGIKFVLKSDFDLTDVSYSRPRQFSCIVYGGKPASC